MFVEHLSNVISEVGNKQQKQFYSSALIDNFNQLPYDALIRASKNVFFWF